MDKVAGMLHLCNKAGQLVFGREAVLALSGRGEIALVLMAGDSGNDLKRKLSGMKTVILDWSSREFGGLFGRNLLSVTGVKDKRFASEIERLLTGEGSGRNKV